MPACCGCTPVLPLAHALKRRKFATRRLRKKSAAIVPARELDSIIDDIGLPNGGWNLALTDTSTIDSGDGEILISLKKDHQPTVLYERRLRKELARKFPDMGFFFQAADITGQILNFGLPAPLDLQVFGRSPQNYEIAQQLAEKIACIPGATDVHVHQIVNYPVIQLDVDRSKAMELGLTQRDVSNNMLISPSASSQISPQHWVNWRNGVNYNLSVQTPQYDIDSLAALLRTRGWIHGRCGEYQHRGSLAGTANEMRNSVGTSPGGATAAYGNPGSVAGGTQLLSNLVDVKRALAPALGESLQRDARV